MAGVGRTPDAEQAHLQKFKMTMRKPPKANIYDDTLQTTIANPKPLSGAIRPPVDPTVHDISTLRP
jgi:hypothetical protein